jgi:hypothetical protein
LTKRAVADPQQFRRHFRTLVRVQFREKLLHVVVRRVERNAERAGDFRVRLALRQQQADLLLLRRQGESPHRLR